MQLHRPLRCLDVDPPSLRVHLGDLAIHGVVVGCGGGRLSLAGSHYRQRDGSRDCRPSSLSSSCDPPGPDRQAVSNIVGLRQPRHRGGTAYGHSATPVPASCIVGDRANTGDLHAEADRGSAGCSIPPRLDDPRSGKIYAAIVGKMCDPSSPRPRGERAHSVKGPESDDSVPIALRALPRRDAGWHNR